MSKEKEILLGNIDACKQRVEKLSYSLNKNRPLFPLTTKTVAQLSDEQEESIDALILRYSQIVSMIQDQVFRGIAYIEQEDISHKSNRDKVLLMEKLGAIHSADGLLNMTRRKIGGITDINNQGVRIIHLCNR